VTRALATLVVAVATLAGAASARADIYTVDSLEDTGVAADGSLRGELKAANQHEGPDAIDFAPGLAGTITLAGNGLTITGPVDIEGPGPAALTVRQIAGGHRVFLVKLAEAGAVTIAGLHVTGGSTPERGGDIAYTNSEGAKQATLTISDCLVDDGSAADEGGGIASYEAPLTLRDSVVTENEAGGGGGVLVGGKGFTWTIEDTTISGNEAGGNGGGVLAEDGQGRIFASTIAENRAGEVAGGAYLAVGPHDSIAVVNSTIAANGADDEGGGIAAFAESSERGVTIEDSTIAGNHGGGGAKEAGGLQIFGAVPRPVVDSIVADNIGGAPDVSGAVAAAFSLIGDPTGAALTEAVPGSDLIGVDPLLAPLADNGGPTETMAPSPRSPVVNKGGGGLTTDQRGAPRPVIYAGVPLSAAPGADGADIGAVELASGPASPPPPAIPPAPAPPRKLQVRVSCPKGASPAGCRFALQVVSGKPRKARGKGRGAHTKTVPPTPESAVARVKLGAGRSALVMLTPKPKFAAKLAAASTVLVREAATANGKATTAYKRLKVIGG
jgi:hypothetical protein